MTQEPTVRMSLRHSVGRGGKFYGPGIADVPESLANALRASGAAVSEEQASEGTSSEGTSSESASPEGATHGAGDAAGDKKAEPKRATKAALKEYGDADALRALAAAKGVTVADDATKADLVDALHAAEISLDE